MALIGILVLNPQCSNDGISGSIFVNFPGCKCDISGSVICVEYLRGKKNCLVFRGKDLLTDWMCYYRRLELPFCLASPFLFGFVYACIKKNDKATNSVPPLRKKEICFNYNLYCFKALKNIVVDLCPHC